jgi:Rrf2 family iron-sulfur cluster assembly transcriptional regulator
MLKVNKNVEVALKTLEILNEFDKPLRTESIAHKIEATPDYVEQVVRKLRMAGIVRAVRGPGGGYVVNRGQTVSALTVASLFGYETTTSLEGMAGSLAQALNNAFKTTTIDL